MWKKHLYARVILASGWLKCLLKSTWSRSRTYIHNIIIMPGPLISISRPMPLFAYLSEDETGGGGAAIRPLESAPPWISPSIHLYGKKNKNKISADFICDMSDVFLVEHLLYLFVCAMWVSHSVKPHRANTQGKVTFMLIRFRHRALFLLHDLNSSENEVKFISS